jgi:hypothetical protein
VEEEEEEEKTFHPSLGPFITSIFISKVQSNSLNLAPTGLVMCRIMKYSGPADSSYTDLSSYI